jgi:hypothetical protein
LVGRKGRRAVMVAPFDDLLQPSASYNPEYGLMAVQNPRAFVQQLAKLGHEPPGDFPEDFKLEDAHKTLGTHLAMNMTPQEMSDSDFSGRFSGLPFAATPEQGPDAPREPLRPTPAPSWDTAPRPMTLPNVTPPPITLPNVTMPPMAVPRVTLPLPSGGDPDIPGAAPEETDPYGGVTKRKVGQGALKTDVGGFEAQKGLRVAAPRAPAVEDTPPPATPTSISTSESVPDTSKKPGGLNVLDPTPMSPTPQKLETKKAEASDVPDNFGKALAGLTAIKPAPVQLVHGTPIPHAPNQIARSNLPQALLQQLVQASHPAQKHTFGELLRGR